MKNLSSLVSVLFLVLSAHGQKTAGPANASAQKKITVSGKVVATGKALSVRSAGITGGGDKTAALQTLVKTSAFNTFIFDESNRRYLLSAAYNGGGKVHHFRNGARVTGAAELTNLVVDAPAGVQVFDTASKAIPLNDVWYSAWFGFSPTASAATNSKAIKNIEWAINQRGGNVVLELDKGRYAVGTQIFAGQFNGGYSYRSEDVFHLQGVSNVDIRGNGATIETSKGLKVGSFHPVTGGPVYPRVVTTNAYPVGNNVTVMVRPMTIRVRAGAVFNFANGAQLQVNRAAPEGATSLTGNLYNKPLVANDSGAIWGYDDYNYRAAAPFVFKFSHSKNIRLQNLMFYGNIENTVLGGHWGSGYEVAGTGIRLVNTSGFVAERVESNNHVTDGLEVTNYAYSTSDTIKKVTLLNCKFIGNGRQGFSWTGGNHLYARSCEFSNTGQTIHKVVRRRIFSGPGGGIDIEPEADNNGKLLLCLNGTFDSCRFENNEGISFLVAARNRASNINVNGGVIESNNTGTVYADGEQVTFTGVKLIGASVTHFPATGYDDVRRTRYIRCYFTMQPSEYRQPVNNTVGNTFQNVFDNQFVLLDRCTFDLANKPVYIIYGEVVSCVFKNSSPRVSYIQASLLKGKNVFRFKGAAEVDINGSKRLGELDIQND